MRKTYVLDAAKRRARALMHGADGEEGAATRRRRLIAIGALLLLVAALAFWGWRTFSASREPVAPAPGPVVPEHQRSGPLANPWGGGAPSTGAEDAAAAAAAASAAARGAQAGGTQAGVNGANGVNGQGGPNAARAAGPIPPSREALREALAKLRAGGNNAVEYVAAALQSGDGAALVAAWMVERQCRLATHWRQVSEWRSRVDATRQATPAAAMAARGPLGGAGNYLPAFAACQPMPDVAGLEEALERAGYPPSNEQMIELTRRPIDLALAVSVGDPLLIAEVIDATPGHLITQRLQAWGVDARDLESPEVVRAALWIASCTPAGGAASSGMLPACREHPALLQACIQNGLCDARDLRDLFLRSMPADAMGASERLGRTLAARMGK
jgi:hypothetical protein